MSSKPVLKIDWATHEAAKFACENWHYSKCMPAGKMVRVGAWENGKFIGIVLFSRGACNQLLTPYGLSTTDGCELTRIALAKHENSVSRIMSLAIRFLKRSNPGMRLLVSFADPKQGHHGGVYQATNWIYTGLSTTGGTLEYLINGKWTHHRSVGAKFGQTGKAFADEKGIPYRKPTRKHTYVMPLDEEIRRKVSSLSKPYPKRAGSSDVAVPDDQSGEGGSTPTSALQSPEQFETQSLDEGEAE